MPKKSKHEKPPVAKRPIDAGAWQSLNRAIMEIDFVMEHYMLTGLGKEKLEDIRAELVNVNVQFNPATRG